LPASDTSQVGTDSLVVIYINNRKYPALNKVYI